VQGYLKELRQDYPVEKARGMLGTLRAAQEPPKPKSPQSQEEMILHVEDDSQDGGPLKVYPLREPRQEPARPRPLKKTSPPAARPNSMLGRSNAPSPAAGSGYPLRPTPRPPQAPALRPREREVEERGPAGGAWLASLLIVLLAAAGLGLAVYTLARPFVPPEWLP
jgi:hypothetical protein